MASFWQEYTQPHIVRVIFNQGICGAFNLSIQLNEKYIWTLGIYTVINIKTHRHIDAVHTVHSILEGSETVNNMMFPTTQSI